MGSSAGLDVNTHRWLGPIRAVIVAAGIGVYLSAAIAVVLGADGRIRFTADSTATIPIWHPWLPAAVGVTLALFVPPKPPTRTDRASRASRDFMEALVLLALAVAFTLALTLLGPSEPNYTLLKLVLLLMCPVLLFVAGRRRGRTSMGGGSAAVDDRRSQTLMAW